MMGSQVNVPISASFHAGMQTRASMMGVREASVGQDEWGTMVAYEWWNIEKCNSKRVRMPTFLENAKQLDGTALQRYLH